MGKKEVNKIRRINPISRKLMPACRETGRDLIERIFCEGRCRLRTLEKKTHRTAPSRPGERKGKSAK